jgi:hypothetical protein
MPEKSTVQCLDEYIESLGMTGGFDPKVARGIAIDLDAAKSDQSDFFAYMSGELSKWPCMCENEGHKGTAPMFWPELIACIIKKAVQDKQKELDLALECIDAIEKHQQIVAGSMAVNSSVIAIINSYRNKIKNQKES